MPEPAPSGVQAIAVALADAMSARDIDAFVSLFAVRYDSRQSGHPDRAFVGRDELRANWSAIFAGVPDFRAELLATAVDDDIVFSEWRWRGTQRDGTPLDMAGVIVGGILDGQLAWARLYVEPVDAGAAGLDAAVREMSGTPPAGDPPVLRSDEELQRVTVGERVPHDGPITLAAPDPAWPAAYEREARRIRGAIGAGVSLLEHVGSTSVPGLPAKPIIDIVLAVRDPVDEAAYVPVLEAAGYELRIREPDWHEHRMLERADPAVHLHVFAAGAEEIDRMLAFRDRLRVDRGDRDRYAAEKRRLAGRRWRHVQHYADAKTAVVEAILARAG